MKNDWSWVAIKKYRRTEFMVIKPMIGGGWHCVCYCDLENDAKILVDAVNDLNRSTTTKP